MRVHGNARFLPKRTVTKGVRRGVFVSDKSQTAIQLGFGLFTDGDSVVGFMADEVACPLATVDGECDNTCISHGHASYNLGRISDIFVY